MQAVIGKSVSNQGNQDDSGAKEFSQGTEAFSCGTVGKCHLFLYKDVMLDADAFQGLNVVTPTFHLHFND